MIDAILEELISQMSEKDKEIFNKKWNPYPDIEFRKTETGFDVSVTWYENS